MVGRVIALGVLGLVPVVLLAALLVEKAGTKGEEPYRPPQIGRHVVARVSGDEIILLDTVTGELYRARPEDIKPYPAIFGEEAPEEPAEEPTE